jgi:hypothetical protein
MAMRRVHVLGAAILGSLTAAFFQPATATAQAICGGRIQPGETVVLREDLQCDGRSPGLTVEGPAILDLNGYAIRCDDANGDGNAPQAGILVIGSGATVRNGVVRDCAEGILVAGDGRHLVAGMTALFSESSGLRVASDSNLIRDNQIFFTAADGLEVDGRLNRVIGNSATGNQGFGYFVRQRNTLTRNIASGNRDAGFVVVGVRSVVSRNRVLGSPRGFLVTGQRNRFTANEAEACGAGFTIDGPARGNVLARNEMSDNKLGVLVIGDGNRLVGTRAERNEQDGIRLLATVADTTVKDSVALDNGRFDLVDDTPGCGTNAWRGSTFGKSNQGCVE